MLRTNTSLIRRVRDPGDMQSWGEFVALYEPLLISYVCSRGVMENDARDVVQEIFIALLRALPNFQLDHEKGRFRTWLWQVTMNGIADQFRRGRKQGKAAEAWLDRPGGRDESQGEPDEQWIKAHRQRVLDFVLPKIKAQSQPRTWLCFEEHLLKGRSGVAIAQELGITANAVCVNANRVLDKVRELCAEYLEEFEDENRPLPG
jgi:RNA polymerase sigma-70 factor, ECF subfamily